jgi:glycosyltransferase involved in cell wall biosynthesis
MVAVVVPVPNEKATIRNVIKAIPKNIMSDVTVVDDASHDETPRIAKEVRAVVVCHGRNLGVGAAIKTGYSKALDLGSEGVKESRRLEFLR